MYGHLKETSKLKCKLLSKVEEIKQVTKFKYLGYLIIPGGRRTSEISKTIFIAKDTFPKMKPILANRNISMKIKLKVMKRYVWSVLVYGSEYWTINKETEKKLEAVKMWFISRMVRISWTEKESKEQEKKLEAVEIWFIRGMMRISWTEKKSNELVLKETKS
ncbi:endonuclease-reverse transcriptase [Plakobranchus ocellatus]|uniref:Endonuclease-reverse transcriptase n=1 Tax=Plakobranchus ocellatus TaxID=259542 RepID=A0AAV4C7T0_9GAST|nr:endonuclease-reverse transcriptase [Plakobranchus ocellatus]